MNIKSLLIGSAAALVAVSGAQAADAIVVAEPEPMEYVRVCDVYGAGFFYIPGTETCLRVGGYMQYDIGVGFLGHENVLDKRDAAFGILDTNDTYFKQARVSLQVDARSETELGTLRGFLEARFNHQSDVTVGGVTFTENDTVLEQGFIELGGFRIGRTDTLFETGTGAAGNVINDDVINYGTFQTMSVSYTFTGANGFSAAIALEEGEGELYTIDSYVPHVVAAASFTQGWGGVSAVVAYDSVWEEWAGRARLDVNVAENFSLWIMAGYKSGADDADWGGADTPNLYGRWVGDWALFGGGSYQVNEKAQINLALSYANGNSIWGEEYAAVANVDYELVPGFTITPEVAYRSTELLNSVEGRDDEFAGYLRFRRSF